MKLQLTFYVIVASIAMSASLPLLPAGARGATQPKTTCHTASERDTLIGQWEREDGSFAIVYLPDGRAASRLSRDHATAATVRVEPGTYRVEGNRIRYEWMMTEPEEEEFSVEGDTLIVGVPKSPVKSRLRRVGGADKAAQTYAAIYEELRQTAELSFQEVAVGPIKPGLLSAVDIVPDKRSTDIFTGATAYRQETYFQWVLTPVHLYQKHQPDEPGVTACSYTFLPNGRFYFDGWLYGVDLDAKIFNEDNPAEVRQHEVTVKHQQFWGKYRVVPGRNALDGDTVEMVDNGGYRHTVRVVDGRRYLITSKSRMLFNNFQQVRKHRQ